MSKFSHPLIKGKLIDLRSVEIRRAGLRPASFAYLKGGGKVRGSAPQVDVRHDGSLNITDGRHRILLARESGKRIDVVVRWYGPRGGLLRKENMVAVA